MTSAMSDSVIEALLARVSIRDVIAQYVTLQRRGSRFVGLCPFHDDKTPSFSVDEAKGGLVALRMAVEDMPAPTPCIGQTRSLWLAPT